MKLLSGTMKGGRGGGDQAEARRKRGKQKEKHAGHTVYSGSWCRHRQTAPTGHCLLCLPWPIVSVPINLLAPCAKSGKGWADLK